MDRDSVGTGHFLQNMVHLSLVDEGELSVQKAAARLHMTVLRFEDLRKERKSQA